MALKLLVDGLKEEEVNNSYIAICDANRIASAFYIKYRGKKICARPKKNRQRIGSSFVFEAVPVAAAIRRVPKIYNGSKDPVIVASDHWGLIEYAKYYFDWGMKKTEEIKSIESRYTIAEMEAVRSMLEPVREITESYPIFFGKIKASKKSDNIAHVLCTAKANKLKRQELKKMLKSNRNFYRSMNYSPGNF